MVIFDTIYYVCIGAVMLCMILFNNHSFLRKSFHSLLRYDLKVDMFVNDNEGEHDPNEAEEPENQKRMLPNTSALFSATDCGAEPTEEEVGVQKTQSVFVNQKDLLNNARFRLITNNLMEILNQENLTLPENADFLAHILGIGSDDNNYGDSKILENR